MRFRQRRNVDLPHPEGPMMAVMRLVWIPIDTPRTARVRPKKACTSTARIRSDAVLRSSTATRCRSAAPASARVHMALARCEVEVNSISRASPP
jgi:hypothetical protein